MILIEAMDGDVFHFHQAKLCKWQQPNLKKGGVQESTISIGYMTDSHMDYEGLAHGEPKEIDRLYELLKACLGRCLRNQNTGYIKMQMLGVPLPDFEITITDFGEGRVSFPPGTE